MNIETTKKANRTYLTNVLSCSPKSHAALAGSVLYHVTSQVSTFNSKSSLAAGNACTMEFVVPGEAHQHGRGGGMSEGGALGSHFKL